MDLNLEICVFRYGARLGSERSGAYLFLPDKEAQVLSLDKPLIKVIEGPIYSRVEVDLPGVVHSITLHNSPGNVCTLLITVF